MAQRVDVNVEELLQVVFKLSTKVYVSRLLPALEKAAEELLKKRKENCFKKEVELVRLDGAGILFRSERMNSAVIPCNKLLQILQTLYRIASEVTPCVIHVLGPRTMGDPEFVQSFDERYEPFVARDTGLVILVSKTPRECRDIAVISHLAAYYCGVPVLHFTDSSGSVITSPVQTSLDDASIFQALEHLTPKQEVTNTEELGTVKKESEEPLLYLRSTNLRKQTSVDANLLDVVMEQLESLLQNRYRVVEYIGSSDAEIVIISLASGPISTVVEQTIRSFSTLNLPDVHSLPKPGLLKIRLLRPWPTEQLLSTLPKTVTTVVVLEINNATQLEDDVENLGGPLFVDVAASLVGSSHNVSVISGSINTSQFNINTVKSIFSWVKTPQRRHFTVGSSNKKTELSTFALPEDNSRLSRLFFPTVFQIKPSTNVTVIEEQRQQQQAELPYIKMLGLTVGNRALVTNATGTSWTEAGAKLLTKDTNNANYAYGVLIGYMEKKRQTEQFVQEELKANHIVDEKLREALIVWLSSNDGKAAHSNGERIVQILERKTERTDVEQKIFELRDYFTGTSLWLIGGDEWADDISFSAIRSIFSSGDNVNILVIDTTCYSELRKGGQFRAKKDLGLYAMNYGNVYVASVALYASYSQTLQAFLEADAYKGPSLILAYAPQPKVSGNSLAAIEALKETKKSVDEGIWPLYRWNPQLADAPGASVKQAFTLDSDKLRADIKEFLSRENQLSMLAREQPQFESTMSSSLNSEVVSKHKALQQKCNDSYATLVKGIQTNPILILFASDGGKAEGVAKRFADEAKIAGMDPRCLAMDDFVVEDLPSESLVIFSISTAGQGETPSNGKEFMKTLFNLGNDPTTLKNTRYCVFGLGDSHYWPRPEEKIYFCKPAIDLDKRLVELGATRLVEVGLGDDQADDGFETALAPFRVSMWTVLGIDVAMLNARGAGGSKLPPDDDIKRNSNFLRGTIAQGLEDSSTGALVELDTKLTKFHGIYQQDDRDLRESRRQQGLEKAYSFMVRVRVPGGICTPAQWLQMDQIADEKANGTIRLTTRQAFQLHGIIKKNLKPAIREINRALMDTIAACGDVNRNVMCNPNPYLSELHEEVYEFAKRFSEHLTPQTSAYHEIWLDKKLISGNAVQDVEPIYGPTYLPRKFKTVVAVPPNNDVDVYAHDLGFIAIVEDGKLAGFNVTVGGGMGMTHNNKKTFPRLADLLGFCTVDQAVDVGEKVVTVQRDYGDRTNRKHARLKYTIEDRGIDWFRQEVEARLGYNLQPARPFHFADNGDRLGWVKGHTGKWHFCLFIQNGRVIDTPDYPLKTALKEIATIHKGDFRLTANQSLIIGNIDEDQVPHIKGICEKYKIDNSRYSGLRLNSMACVALPTCALALAESERYLPVLITKLEEFVEEAGLRHDAIVIRMTGCPNGCARPYLGEIGLVGRAPGIYNLYLGAGHAGERLNKLYKESVNEEGILQALKPIILNYAKDRLPGEHFGDFVIRAGYVVACLAGRNFHD